MKRNNMKMRIYYVGAQKPKMSPIKKTHLPFAYSFIAQVTSGDHFIKIYLFWC